MFVLPRRPSLVRELATLDREPGVRTTVTGADDAFAVPAGTDFLVDLVAMGPDGAIASQGDVRAEDAPGLGFVKTGADGRYELPGVRAGRSSQPEVRIESVWPWGEEAGGRSWGPNPPPAATPSVVVRPAAGTTVEAPDIILPAGEPDLAVKLRVVEAGELVLAATGSLTATLRSDASGRGRGPAYAKVTVSDASGTVVHRRTGELPGGRTDCDLLPGEYDVEAVIGGSVEPLRRRVVIAAGERVEATFGGE